VDQVMTHRLQDQKIPRIIHLLVSPPT
jgi:hypothetical protein